MFQMSMEYLAFTVKNRLGFTAPPLTFRSDKQDKRSVLLDLGAVLSGSGEALHSSLIIKCLGEKGPPVPSDHTRRIGWEEFQTALRGSRLGEQAQEKEELVCVCA